MSHESDVAKGFFLCEAHKADFWGQRCSNANCQIAIAQQEFYRRESKSRQTGEAKPVQPWMPLPGVPQEDKQ